MVRLNKGNVEGKEIDALPFTAIGVFLIVALNFFLFVVVVVVVKLWMK
jgi:hypothetical protein